MKQKLFYIGLAFAVCILALLLKDLVREGVVIPIIMFFRFIDEIPQIVIWFLCIGIMVMVAYNSISKRSFSIPEFRRSKRRHRGRIEQLSDMIKKARQGGYFGAQLSKYLGDLILKTMALRERLTREIIKERLEAGTLDAPPDILAYMQRGLLEDSFHYQKRRKGLSRSEAQDSPHDPDPGKVVEFLEHQLEDFNGTKDY